MSIKVYEATIKTVGPVHIGCGQTIRKQDYIYDFHKSKVHIVNGAKLVKFLKNKGLLDSYQEFLRRPPKNPRESGLKNYLDAHRIKQEEWKSFIKFSEHVNQGKKHGSYRPKPLNDIHLMVRDGQNQVYIPGSSVKGALKTAIISKYQNEAQKDIFSKIKVSDSEPIDACHLAVYQKIDINKVEKPMPLYRECIEANTEIRFTLSLEDEVFTIEDIEECIQSFYKNYYNEWLIGFKETNGGRRFSIDGGVPNLIGKNVLYLGAGTGFVSKTTHYQLKNRSQAKKDTFEILKKKFSKTYRKMKEIPSNVPVALKGTINENKKESYQQGMCIISFNSK
ncbi:type III-A CRISPR-associated RAMP protein Csm5 [Staphylococcus schleiferi]|uniref:type III-A CRISPR-associated RAMP protein Csm5 n=1 Tax=Staphylococcus sp. 191 TaxID=2070016 RepID=UPI0013F44B56|nr:type III-A CRISPR-associated RAMP protein Csm5 [Staphylococcus sp. 191]NHA35396.1 type III-A CRISPR-associated RAMP protein Csm5 [Staphylococcus schleiferi]NHB71079.1 type III-A CRISPR-associated RAMP protein Csm5 [Staphylococcus sp. 191]